MAFPVKSTRSILALTILSLVLPAGALETDNRPLYYVMLKALESRFVDYNTRVEADYERKIETLAQAHRDQLRALDRERAVIDAAWRDGLREHDRRRVELDEATAALNERIRDLHESWKAHDELRAEHGVARAGQSRLDVINEALAQNVDTIRGLWRRYNARASAVQASELRLRELTEDYRSGRHPVARTLRQLSQEYQAFARAQSEAVDAELAAYEREREDFERWLSRGERDLARLDEALRETTHAYRLARSAHDRARDELSGLIERHNTLVEILNAGDAAANRREAAVTEMAALQDRIDSDRARLEGARDEALALLHATEARRLELERHRRQLESEKSFRERALAAEHVRLQGKVEQLRANLGVRRRATQAQVRALEEQMEVGLKSARARLDEQAEQVSVEFGEEFPELFRATMAWLEGGEEPDPLYESDGSTPRFSRATPAANAVYAALERIDAQRAEADRIVGEIRTSGEAVASSDELLTRQNNELKMERARIANADRALRAAEQRRREDSSTAVGAWNERRSALVSERVKAVEEVKAVYGARLALTGQEFETLQGVLLASLRDEPIAITPQRDTATLYAELVRSTAHSGMNPENSLLERNALFNAISSGAISAVAAPRRDHAEHARWESYRGQPIAERRGLDGDRKHAVIRSWFDTLSSRAPIARLRGQLIAHLTEVDNVQVDRFLGALFETGMSEYAHLVEIRFEDGTMGIQAVVLDNRYWIETGGSLERIPEP